MKRGIYMLIQQTHIEYLIQQMKKLIFQCRWLALQNTQGAGSQEVDTG